MAVTQDNRHHQNGEENTVLRRPYIERIPSPKNPTRPGRFGTPTADRRTPANGITAIGKVIPGTADKIREATLLLEAAITAEPYAVKSLTAHYIRWGFLDNDTRYMYQAVFDTDFDKYIEDFVGLFNKYSPDKETAFDYLEGCPPDWRTNIAAFAKWIRTQDVNVILEYAEYPGYTCEDVKKALTIKDAFDEVLDNPAAAKALEQPALKPLLDLATT